MFVTTPQSRLTPCQLPGRGAFGGATTNQKLSPRAGKVAWRSHDERGTTQSCPAVLLFPLSRLTPPAPHKWWRLLVQYKHSVQCRTPSRSDRFNGVTGVARGPKGRNRNLPWPPDKKDYKIVCSAFVCFTPSGCSFHSHPPPSTGRLLVHFISFSLQFRKSRRYAGKLLPKSHFRDIFEC